MRVANDLERVGDLAKNIAKRTIAIDEQQLSQKRGTVFRGSLTDCLRGK
jgi:phosphate uptake regulator